MDFMELFFKFQRYVDDQKNCQEWMEEIKGIVEDIVMFQKNHPEALIQIPEMSLHENECCL